MTASIICFVLLYIYYGKNTYFKCYICNKPLIKENRHSKSEHEDERAKRNWESTQKGGHLHRNLDILHVLDFVIFVNIPQPENVA